MNIITSAVLFFIWTTSIISIYYSKFYSNINHLESSSGYLWYLITVWLIYLWYKFFSISAGWKKISFNFWTILCATLVHILVLSVVYSWFTEVTNSPFMQGWASSFVLFFHIIQLLLYPTLLVIITRWVGFTLSKFLIWDWKDIDARIRIPAEITIGFFIFTVGLLFIGEFGYFNMSGLLWLLALLGIAGYPGHRETLHDIKTRHVVIENHNLGGNWMQVVNLRLLSIEFGFFFLTFLLGVALVNIIRPMPIGWDDLGVYMNFPKIMATSWVLLEWAGMYTWQLITATGFLFSYTAAQAFYINQLGGILAVIAIISTLSYAFEKKWSTLIISLPVLFGLIYYAMPMTVFQQAKDMKLDPAYLFFAISGIMLLFHAWDDKHANKKTQLTLLWIIWVIIGFTFTVKLTSIMLILAWLWVIAYRFLNFSGYLGFFFLFIAIFTKWNLWSMMNVPMPKDNPILLEKISLFLIWISFMCFVVSLYKKKDILRQYLKQWLVSSLIFGAWVLIGCAPWLIKNINNIGLWNMANISIGNLLSGYNGVEQYPYESLFSQEELEERKKSVSASMTKDGKSENEDLWRYFWYEWGLNNYLKLPANLTFQKNQNGEFTDITYIFLALLPGLLLFIKWKREYTMLLWGSGILMYMTFYYFQIGFWGPLAKFFGSFSLIVESNNWKTYGYAVLICINIFVLGIFHFATKDTHDNRKLREVIMFMWIYAFLFSIAAFGIVWYGIMIYFGFFLIMWYSSLSFLREEESSEDSSKDIKYILALGVFLFIGLYMTKSAFPHGWNNFKSAYYNEYKYGTLTQEESIFAYRSDYLLPIATMNLENIWKIFDGIDTKMQSSQMKEFFKKTDIRTLPLESLHTFIMKYRNAPEIALRNDVRMLGQHIYSSVLYPPKDNENNGGIYRIGTFMTYLINNNNKRYLDDSLVMLFNGYFYDPSPEKTIERMKSLGLKYLLVDLNAATIDKDPRHALTERAEKLLLTMNAKNLRLVSTDNFCLELALSERKKWKLLTNDEFIDIAGTNYESYRNGTLIYRGQKLANCQKYIVNLINQNETKDYDVIENIKNEVVSGNATQNPEKLQSILTKYTGQSWFALFEIVDTPMEVTSTQTGWELK